MSGLRKQFKPYPKCKPSGVEWIGEIPISWDLKRIDWVMNYSKKNANIRDLKGFDVFHYSIPIIEETGDGQIEAVGQISSDKISLKGNELLVSKLNPRKGMVLISKENDIPIVCSSEFIPMIPKGINLKYSYFLYKSILIREKISSVVESATYSHQRAKPRDITKLWVYLPSLPEQQTIADFLDHETARINTIVDKQRQLIDLLKEKRAALITQAVTKGLDPHARMKDSGVEWIGEIPEGWEVMKLKFLFSFLDNKRIPIAGNIRSEMEKNYPYYGASGIIDHVESYIFDEPLILIGEDGANLLYRSTPLAFLATGKYWVNNHAHILKPNFGPIEYWINVLQCYDYTPIISGSAQPKLTKNNLGNVKLPLPSFEEIIKLNRYISIEANRIDSLISKIEKQIELLTEYKQSLITAAVTGKIDVRGEQQYVT